MNDRRNDATTWQALMDRLDAGFALSIVERDLMQRFIATDPACAREAALIDELSQLDVEADPRTRALEDAVLAAVWSDKPGAIVLRGDIDSDSARTDVVANAHAASNANGKPSSDATVTAPRRLGWVGVSAALVFAAAAMLLLGVGLGRWQRVPATVTRTSAVPAVPARVEVVYAAGAVQVGADTAALGALLSQGQELSVADGAACVAIDPGINVCLSPHSKLRVTQTADQHRRVELLEGQATAVLDPLPEGTRFSIVAGDVWSTAVGTSYAVVRAPDGSVQTAVLSGKVQVSKLVAGQATPGARDKSLLVGAHQRAKVTAQEATLEPMSRAEESPYWTAIHTTRLWREPGTAALQVSAAQEPVTLWLDGQELGHAPLSSLIPAGAHQLTAQTQDGRTVEQTFLVASGKTWRLDLGAALARERTGTQAGTQATAQPLTATTTSSSSTTQVTATTRRDDTNVERSTSDLLSAARQQMKNAQWAAAADTYRQLRALHPNTPEAQTALVPLAQLSLDRLHQPAAALADLDAYLTTGGGSVNQEVRYLRIIALQQLGRNAAADEASRAFLEDFPGSFEAGALRRSLTPQTETRVPPAPEAE